MISLKSSPICRINVTSPKENHMIDKHKKFQLFSFTVRIVFKQITQRCVKYEPTNCCVTAELV